MPLPWPLSLKRTAEYSVRAAGTRTEALSLLHNSLSLIKLNPVVTDVTQAPDDPDVFVVMDRLVVFGVFTMNTPYTIRFAFNDDGFTSTVDAGMGTLIKHRWTVGETETPGQVEIKEVLDLEAPCFLIHYILGTIRTTHPEMLKRAKAYLEERSRQENPEPIH